jgi:hypothetical protein
LSSLPGHFKHKNAEGERGQAAGDIGVKIARPEHHEPPG